MTDELRHHGIIGQKWGVRRFQNKDGSLTSAGKKRIHYRESLVPRDRENHGVMDKLPSVLRPSTKGGPYPNSSHRPDIREQLDRDRKNIEAAKAFIKKLNDKRLKRSRDAITKDIDSLKPYSKTGIATKKGKVVLTAKDVNDMIEALTRQRDKYGNI